MSWCSCSVAKEKGLFCRCFNNSPRLKIACKWNKNCTGKIMVPLKFLRKRSSRFGATCWGITTHQANRADGLCKYCKGLPHPPAHASLWVVIPQHVAPNLELLFPNYFSGTYGISVQFFFDWPIFSNGVLYRIWSKMHAGITSFPVKEFRTRIFLRDVHHSFAIGAAEIFVKKKFKIWCHMLGYNDLWG